ncbi:hypothetical protein POJ06DRAFT_298875 [Lipomyces tetrasporus]|uniref:Uncharacterized protein n=1 Tax=Lipomyces tetrasporus TaxID=54092 RepID=A0AAD7VTX6_9ASCO|nr:uncharacterized protein POJ06DRAFT_298875 [Lipomyces tetrasporus]KAJ8102532.1 hypothetical protein POJ06DRAFT_298875 [Lipomyces tetrasporus]
MAVVMLLTQMSNCAGQPDAIMLLQSRLKICAMACIGLKITNDHADWILALSESLRQKLELSTGASSSSTSRSVAVNDEYDCDFTLNPKGIITAGYAPQRCRSG